MSIMLDKQIHVDEMETQLEAFVTHAPTLNIDETGQAARAIFDGDPGVEGIVVLENRQPAGIIMRTAFYQKYGSLYGHSLYTNRPVKLLMDSLFMSADIRDAVSKISLQAMSRDQGKIYDYIVVFNNRAYCGVISIRNFLIELARRNDAQISVLKTQQMKLMAAHEQEVRLRQDVEYRSTALKNLMDHADQGFLSFDSTLIVRDEYSYKCAELIGESIAGVHFIELISAYFPEEKTAVFHMVLDSYFSNGSPVTDQVYLMLLPSDCVIRNRHVHLDYRKIENSGKKGVMVILNDVTDRIMLEKALADDQNRQRLLIKAFGYQAEIKRALQEFRDLVSGGYLDYFVSTRKAGEGMNALLRAIHTFKGDFAQLGFIETSRRLHDIETQLIGLAERGGSAEQAGELMTSVNPDRLFEDELGVIYDVLGKGYLDQSEVFSVSRERLENIKKRIGDGSVQLEKNDLLRLLSELEYKNIKVYLNRFDDYLGYLSERLVKARPVYIIEGDDIDIDGEYYAEFFKNLVHIFRNIMDHAIENEDERAGQGKPERALVTCRVEASDDRGFKLTIADDGCGIDLDKVVEKAVQKGFCSYDLIENMTPDERARLIFSDGLSTKEETDEISGRGVGMAAVYQSCMKLGGKIRISTKKGQGTVFTFILPYSAA